MPHRPCRKAGLLRIASTNLDLDGAPGYRCRVGSIPENLGDRRRGRELPPKILPASSSPFSPPRVRTGPGSSDLLLHHQKASGLLTVESSPPDKAPPFRSIYRLSEQQIRAAEAAEKVAVETGRVLVMDDDRMILSVVRAGCSNSRLRGGGGRKRGGGHRGCTRKPGKRPAI